MVPKHRADGGLGRHRPQCASGRSLLPRDQGPALRSYPGEIQRRPRDRVAFREGRVLIGNREIELAELALSAIQARVQLSATGFYKTRRSAGTAPR